MRFYFIPNRRFWTLLTLFVFLVFIVAPVAAQDGSVPTPDTQPISPAQAGELLLGSIVAIVAAGFGGAPITAFLVGLAKHVPFLDAVSAPTLNLFVGGILTVLYWLASHFGLEIQFKSASDFILVAGPAVLTLFTTMAGASQLHKAAAAEKLPVLGYKRTA